MSKLFTEVKTKSCPYKITHEDKIFLIGSCFTDEIGDRFIKNGFDIMKNPFGVIYNPLSIANLINKSLTNEEFDKKDVIKSGEFYYLFSTHGDIRATTENDTLNYANNVLLQSNNHLQYSTVVIITLGTAWSYWYKSSDRLSQNQPVLMANCHKIPQKYIDRRLLTIEEIVGSLTKTIDNIRSINKKIRKVIFTVSPVRHIKEGLYDNKLSKSVLNLAVEEVVCSYDKQSQQDFQVEYFPSYEIIMDELRDYRFYAKDLVHLNEVGVDYIWEKFSDCYFSATTKEKMEKYYKLFLMKNHRPFNPNSEGYRQHLEKIKKLETSLGVSVDANKQEQNSSV